MRILNLFYITLALLFFQNCGESTDLSQYRTDGSSLTPMVTISQQSPALTSANAGDVVTLFITVTASAPVAYKWLFNSVTIDGAASENLILNNVAALNAGVYQVVIMDPATSQEIVRSGEFTLTVNATTPGSGFPCSFGGLTVLDGQSVTAYSGFSSNCGDDCDSEVRTCTNGTLSGTFTQTKCGRFVTYPVCP